MKNTLEYIRRLSKKRFSYEPLITVEISRERLLHNLREFQKVAPGGVVAPVLKSNAYGHGLFEIANILEEENAKFAKKSGISGKSVHNTPNAHTATIPFFVVDSYFEALALRGHGIKTPILIVGYTRPETILNSHLKNISFTITNIDTLRDISKILMSTPLDLNTSEKSTTKIAAKIAEKITTKISRKKIISLHIKIDTGMRRQGILPTEIPEAITLLRKSPNLSIEGLLSHFSDADNIDHSFTEKQISTWNELSRRFKIEFPTIKYLHLSATDGHRFTGKIESTVSRLGIGLYGLSDDLEFSRKMNLRPVLQMKTIVTGIKELKAGETTGYGNIFTAWKDTVIATIPVGYFEGLNRKLSNNGAVIAPIDDKNRLTCPIVGRVSMNITTIEIPQKENRKEKLLHVGSAITAISDNPTDPNSILSIAKKSGTITYEIAVHIPAHLKRVVI